MFMFMCIHTRYLSTLRFPAERESIPIVHVKSYSKFLVCSWTSNLQLIWVCNFVFDQNSMIENASGICLNIFLRAENVWAVLRGHIAWGSWVAGGSWYVQPPSAPFTHHPVKAAAGQRSGCGHPAVAQFCNGVIPPDGMAMPTIFKKEGIDSANTSPPHGGSWICDSSIRNTLTTIWQDTNKAFSLMFFKFWLFH